jgi:hypothetical protein
MTNKVLIYSSYLFKCDAFVSTSSSGRDALVTAAPGLFTPGFLLGQLSFTSQIASTSFVQAGHFLSLAVNGLTGTDIIPLRLPITFNFNMFLTQAILLKQPALPPLPSNRSLSPTQSSRLQLSTDFSINPENIALQEHTR